MAKDIQTISNRGAFVNIFARFFADRKVFLKLKDKNIEVTFLNYEGGLASVRTPFTLSMPASCQIITRIKRNLICVNASPVRQVADTVFLNPSNIQIVTSPRQDMREILSPGSNKIAFATNIISGHVIEKDLGTHREQLAKIKEMIKYGNRRPFELMKIHFAEQEFYDNRMKYFLEHRKPLYIPDFRETRNAAEEKLLDFYMKQIHAHDAFLKSRTQYISELSVPIMFRNKIPYGYVQTNNSSPFTSGMIPVVQRIASHIEDLSVEYGIFSPAQHSLPVSDISSKGLGIVFKDRNHLSYYRENGHVSLDVVFPRKKKASLLADVRHIDILENRIIKIGFEIRDMDEFSQDNYNSFLRSVTFG